MSCPTVVTYSLTQQCNLRCKHCYSNSTERAGERELTSFQAKKVVESIADAGSRVVIFDGGEPLLRSDIYELIALAKKLGLVTVLGTNGTLITPAVVRMLLKAGLDHCAVSLDGATPAMHESLRGVSGCFEKALRGARLIQRSGIPLQVNTCIHRGNQHELKDILYLAESLRAHTLEVFFYVNTGRRNQELLPPEMSRDTLESLDTPINLRLIGMPQFKAKNVRHNVCCSAGESVACIFNDGTVYPCMLLPIPLGNIMKRSLKDIWTTSPLIEKIKTCCDEGTGACKQLERLQKLLLV
jgi:MoaA/NifB/PqqE/SkfB family radical SAM enzyme